MAFQRENTMKEDANKIIIDDQLKNIENFIQNCKLYLKRCMTCGNTKKGRENWELSVTSGKCEWCGWEDKEDSQEGTS